MRYQGKIISLTIRVSSVLRFSINSSMRLAFIPLRLLTLKMVQITGAGHKSNKIIFMSITSVSFSKFVVVAIEQFGIQVDISLITPLVDIEQFGGKEPGCCR